MSKQDEYKLNFAKYKRGQRVVYECTCWQGTQTTFNLAELFSTLSNQLPEDLLEEIDNALSRKDFEEYFSLDGPTSFQIIIPNCIINNESEINLVEFRLLLLEWIEFCKR